MAKFKYRMQNILDVTEKLESQERANFSVANAALDEEQEKLQQLLVRRAGYEKHLAELNNGTLDLHEIRSTKEAIESMKQLIKNQMLAVRNAQRRVELARKRLDDIMKDRKTHENLKEKAFEEFKQELAQEESRATDELVSYTYRIEHEE
ncbi:MAG: flagellar export protein FliJ [Lachnospiraceae bacterium]|nr:flagellar export protein FliJ [Lachnospiraceae bacterium]